MKTMIHTESFTQNYYQLFKNLNDRAKIELINWLSNSLLEKEENKTDDFFDCFGTFISDKSAEKQIEEIKDARYFSDKNFEL